MSGGDRKGLGSFPEAALVLEMGENGLGVIRSLAKEPRTRIIGIGMRGSPGFSSRYLAERYPLETIDDETVIAALQQINARHEVVIPFATGNDFWVRVLWEHREVLGRFRSDFAASTLDLMHKTRQRDLAREMGIPYPASCTIADGRDLAGLSGLRPPIIVKPAARNTRQEAFRLKVFDSVSTAIDVVAPLLGSGTFLASEFIPGGDEELYTFGSYARDGDVLASFTGRKLAQIPRGIGTAGIAEILDEAPTVARDGRRLIERCRFTGISQVEFKRDRRDGRFYLIEINPRSWKWIHLGTLAGVNLPLAQYYTATGRTPAVGRPASAKRYWVSEEFLRYSISVEHDVHWLPWIARRVVAGRVGFSLWDSADPRPFARYCRAAIAGLARRLGSAIRRHR